MSISLSGGRGLSVAMLMVGLGGSAVRAQSAELVWSHDSPGGWVGENVTLGNHGTQVFTSYGAIMGSAFLFSAHDANPPTPVWEDPLDEWTYERRVASSTEGNIHVTMNQEAASGGTYRRATLRCYRADSQTMEWSYEIPVNILNHPYTKVCVSSDGERIVGVVHDSSTASAYITSFASGSSAPLASNGIYTGAAFRSFELSADGTKAVLVTGSKLSVLDVGTMEVEYTKYLPSGAGYGEVSISGDGSLIVQGRIGFARVFERQAGGGYVLQDDLPLPTSLSIKALDISRDGSTIAIGLNAAYEPSMARIQVIDYPSYAITRDYSVQGTGGYQNYVSGLALSADGKTLAVGLLGDQGETVPELLIFKRGISEPILAHDLPGSVNAVDISPSGDRVAVACKGTHANQLGAGGAIRLFSTHTPDFEVEGVPRAGADVDLVQTGRAGTLTRTLAATQLAQQPTLIGNVGLLHLERMATTVLDGAAIIGADGRASLSYTVPSDASLLGTTVYLQGLQFGPRKLSRDWVAMTILP